MFYTFLVTFSSKGKTVHVVNYIFHWSCNWWTHLRIFYLMCVWNTLALTTRNCVTNAVAADGSLMMVLESFFTRVNLLVVLWWKKILLEIVCTRVTNLVSSVHRLNSVVMRLESLFTRLSRVNLLNSYSSENKFSSSSFVLELPNEIRAPIWNLSLLRFGNRDWYSLTAIKHRCFGDFVWGRICAL